MSSNETSSLLSERSTAGGTGSYVATSQGTLWLQSMFQTGDRATWVVAVACLVFSALSLPFAAPERPRVVGALGLAVLGLCVLAVTRLRSDKARFALALTAAGASTAVVFFFGVLGPSIGFFTIALLIFCIKVPPREAIAVTCVATLPQVALHGLMTFRFIAPTGLLVPMEHQLMGELASLQALVVCYVLSLVVGQLIRRQTLKDFDELAQVGREVAAREVLLREARRELEAAGGVGEAGRFTDQILGSFKLGPILGRGGMGEVYEANHVQTDERAAVKLLRPLVGDARGLVERFEREAHILERLDSPHLVRVLEVGGMEAELPFIAMEFLEGSDLGALLRRKRRLSPEDLADLLDQVAEGLSESHANHVVHRDIKPNNLFRTKKGVWKILDFGIARLAGSSGTLTGTKLIGTPTYMSPEQIAESSDVDQRTDVYSLGVVAYRALTGRPAFSNRDFGALMQLILETLPERPSSLFAQEHRHGSAIDSVLRVALAKSPKDRFQSASELADAFRSATAGELPTAVRRHADQLDTRLPWSL